MRNYVSITLPTVSVSVLTCGVYISLAGQMVADQRRPEPSGLDCQRKPYKYLETCTVQLRSGVNTCPCWHKHATNRCVIQIRDKQQLRDLFYSRFKVEFNSTGSIKKKYSHILWAQERSYNLCSCGANISLTL